MKIYINNKYTNQWEIQKVEIIPTNTPTLDETLETFSFALISNDQPLPYAPMQEVKVDFLGDGSDVAYFYIVSDSVDTYCLNPLKYKHTISCIQNTRELSKHLVRNSVFTQPAEPLKNSYNALSMGANPPNSDEPIDWDNPYYDSLNWCSEPLTLSSKEKIKKAFLKISFQYTIHDPDDSSKDTMYINAHTTNNILANQSLVGSLQISSTLILRYKNINNTVYTRFLSPSDFGDTVFDLNKTYDFPLIVELKNEGYKDFEILFPNTNFISGNYIDYEHEYIPNQKTFNYYQVQLQIIAETYYWSVYDILSLLVERQRLKNVLDGVNYKEPLFRLPSWTEGEEPDQDALFVLLINTIAPNFTFTELTMYECVAEVFRLFDAIFTMDENKKLGIEYFNDLSNETITPKITGRNLSLSEDKYTNGLVSYYQDGRTTETFPSNNSFAHLRSVEFGVPENQDHHFIVPHNIQKVIKCELLVDSITRNDGAISIDGDTIIDITPFVVSQDVWSVLNVGSLENDDYKYRIVKQADSVYYVKGDNKIQVASTFKSSWDITQYCLYNAAVVALHRMAGVSAGVDVSHTLKGIWRDIKMRLTYTTMVDGVTKVHSVTNKYDGETLVDQANGAVDLNKMGLNMLGLSLKLGNPTLNATHKITSWANRIKTGQLYNYQGKLWVANVVNYTFFNGYLQGKVSFVENFNQLALRTRLLREKRMTNISNELVEKSEIILTDFIYYSTASINETSENIHFDSSYIINFIYRSFRNSQIRESVDYAILYNANLTIRTYIPLVKYGAGNTINFEMAYDSPMSAGNQTKGTIGWIGSKDYFTKSINYTDNEGFLDVINLKAPTYSPEFTVDFPLITNGSASDYASDYFNISGLEIYKQPNEIFALNYQIAFLPYEENMDFLGSAFINDNIFINPSKITDLYICFKEEKSSFLDTKPTPYFLKKSITSGILAADNIEFLFSAITDAQRTQTKSWCLVDQDENLLFASNRELSNLNNRVKLYFVTKRNRV